MGIEISPGMIQPTTLTVEMIDQVNDLAGQAILDDSYLGAEVDLIDFTAHRGIRFSYNCVYKSISYDGESTVGGCEVKYDGFENTHYCSSKCYKPEVTYTILPSSFDLIFAYFETLGVE